MTISLASLRSEQVIAGLEAAPANDVGGAIDGAVFAPTRAGPGAPGQALSKRFENVLYLGDFGPVGGGLDRSSTFNTMLARANALGEIANGEGKVGITCVVPDGHHVLPGPLTQRIVKDGIHIKGESRQGACLELGTGKTFIWGNGTDYVKTGSLCDMRLAYGSPPPADAVAITVDRAYDLDFRNLQLANIRTLARLGESVDGQSGTTRFSGLKGDAANIGAPLFDLRHGTGFFLEDSEIQVNDASYPLDRTTPHGAIPARNFIEISVGSWDTCHVSNVLTNRFYRAYYIVANTGCGIGYVRIANCIHDLCSDGVLRVTGVGGIARKIDVIGMHGAATDGHGVWLVGGTITDVTLINVAMELCGKNAFRSEFGPTRIKMIGCSDGSCNRLSANTGDDRHSVHMDATDWEIIGGHFGSDGQPITGVAGWQAHTGLDVTAGCDRYRIIGAEWGGATADVALAAHAAGSYSRQIAHCTKMGGGKLSYAGVTSPTVGASPWTWTNLTGMRQTLILYGGTVSSVTLEGVQVAAATGCMIPVSPGEAVVVTYSSAPTARLSTEP